MHAWQLPSGYDDAVWSFASTYHMTSLGVVLSGWSGFVTFGCDRGPAVMATVWWTNVSVLCCTM